MLMILARLVRSESFWAVVKVRSPHNGPKVSYPRPEPTGNGKRRAIEGVYPNPPRLPISLCRLSEPSRPPPRLVNPSADIADPHLINQPINHPMPSLDNAYEGRPNDWDTNAMGVSVFSRFSRWISFGRVG